MAVPIAQLAKPIRQAEDFLVFGSPLIGEDQKREVLDCLDTGWIRTGPKVAQFEHEFRVYKQARQAVAVNLHERCMEG